MPGSELCRRQAGLIGMTKSLAAELGSRGITVNLVAPGFIDTDADASLAGSAAREAGRNDSSGSPWTPDDIAHAVSFCATSTPVYVTGTTLHVNGGMYFA